MQRMVLFAETWLKAGVQGVRIEIVCNHAIFTGEFRGSIPSSALFGKQNPLMRDLNLPSVRHRSGKR